MPKPPKTKAPSLDPYPIQLIQLGVRELSIRADVSPDEDATIALQDCSIRVGHSKYNEQDKTIGVSLKLEVGKDENDPVTLRIQVIGLFQVDEGRFPMNRLLEWAMGNAPVIMLPFLREHAYALTSRCGFKPLILPLAEVNTISIEQPKERKKRSAK
jgi:preprotein translocase subunit SecB